MSCRTPCLAHCVYATDRGNGHGKSQGKELGRVKRKGLDKGMGEGNMSIRKSDAVDENEIKYDDNAERQASPENDEDSSSDGDGFSEME